MNAQDPTVHPDGVITPDSSSAWGVTVFGVFCLDTSVILSIAGGSWNRPRPSTVWFEASTPSEAARVAEVFTAAANILSGVDLVVSTTDELLAGGAFIEGEWRQATGVGPDVHLAPSSTLAAFLDGAAPGIVFASTITAVKGSGDRVGVVLEGGRFASAGKVWSLADQVSEAWFQPSQLMLARETLSQSVGETGVICLISDGAGQSLAIQDTTGLRDDRRLLFSMHHPSA